MELISYVLNLNKAVENVEVPESKMVKHIKK